MTGILIMANVSEFVVSSVTGTACAAQCRELSVQCGYGYGMASMTPMPSALASARHSSRP